MPSFGGGGTYGDVAVNRRGAATPPSSTNKSPMYGSSYTASAAGVGNQRSTSAATGGFGYDGDEEGDLLLPSHTTNDNDFGSYRYTTSSHGEKQQLGGGGGYDKNSATTPSSPSSSVSTPLK